MNVQTGDVLKFDIRLDDGTTDYKSHLCVDAARHFYLMICGTARGADYMIEDYECDLLTYEVSYISLKGVLSVRKIPARHEGPVPLRDEVLRELAYHVDASRIIKDLNKRKIVPGLAAHLGLNDLLAKWE